MCFLHRTQAWFSSPPENGMEFPPYRGIRFPSSVPPVSLLMGFAVCGWCPIIAGSLQTAPAGSETGFRQEEQVRSEAEVPSST